jgi:hypothetical protein
MVLRLLTVKMTRRMDEDSEKENSYCAGILLSMMYKGARDRSLTLPIERVELADSGIPQIVEVTK